MFYRHGNAKPGAFREEDFRIIRDWGFNFVRLSMDYRYRIRLGAIRLESEDGRQTATLDRRMLELLQRY